MNTQKIIDAIPNYLDELKKLDYCKNTLSINHWILYKFKDYCLKNDLKKIERKEIKKFYLESFNIDIDNLSLDTTKKENNLLMIEIKAGEFSFVLVYRAKRFIISNFAFNKNF